MQLLVSVSNAAEARAAVQGGADIIDAKDPLAGALGAVRPDVMARIRRAVDSSLVTAALGDAEFTAGSPTARATSHEILEQLARELVARGARLVKVGFPDVSDPKQVGDIVARLARACASVDRGSGVIAVAYADAAVEGQRIDCGRLLSIAAGSGARGALVDTADKRGPGLLELWNIAALEAWVSEAHSYGLTAAVAGKLRLDDLAGVAETGADIAGVRGAACVGGRMGRVSSERVRALAARVALERSTN